MLKYYYTYYKKQLGYLRRPKQADQTDLFSKVGIINPSIGTTNLGDYIIHDAVQHHLRTMFPTSLFTSYPSHLHTDYDAKSEIGRNNHVFVGGTNLLSSEMDKYYQWKIGPKDKVFLKNIPVLMGVGWWQYQDNPNPYTSDLLNGVLNKELLHSVRDSYTVEKLKSIGITNAVNTSCPTLWSIDSNIFKAVPVKKAKRAVTTLTFYKPNISNDQKLINTLIKNYEEVHLWIQGIEDHAYLKSLKIDERAVKLIPPTLEHYNALVQEDDIEYVGTRLHAGIRALQNSKRTIILAVDNRAVEIGKDTNLNVIPIADVDRLEVEIKKEYDTIITLPEENIRRWKEQFR